MPRSRKTVQASSSPAPPSSPLPPSSPTEPASPLPAAIALSRVIGDDEDDIVENEHSDKLRVPFKNRRTFQKIFVRKGESASGTTTKKYDKEADCPANLTTSIEPTREEIEGRAGTMEMLVIGLVIADDPKRYTTKGTPKDKEKNEARKKRGIVEMPDKVIRAVVPVTENLHSGGGWKYYVTVDATQGTSAMKQIDGESIFFFSEFFSNVDRSAAERLKTKALSTASKVAAARNPDTAPRVKKVVTDSSDRDWTKSNELRVSKRENLGRSLAIQYNMFKLSGNPLDIEAVESTIQNALPNIKAVTMPGSDRVQDFLDEDVAEFTLEDAVEMLAAFEAAYPSFPRMQPGILLEVRELFMKSGTLSSLRIKGRLLLLLDTLQGLIDTEPEEKLDDHVKRAMIAIRIHSKYQISTVSIAEKESPADVLDTVIKPAVAAIKDAAAYHRDYEKAIASLHGGVANDVTVEGVMKNIASKIDEAGFKAGAEEMLAVQASMIAGSHGGAAQVMDDLAAALEKGLPGGK